MKYDCPSCGRPFNGKRCRNCGYESFDEEIAHRLHTHKGEPLVIKDTQRRPIPTADPFGCPPKRKPKKEKSGSRSWPSLVITLCCLLTVLLSAAKDLPFLRQPVPNPFAFLTEPKVTVPEDAISLYSDSDIDVFAQWEPAAGIQVSIPLYIRNNTSKKLQVTAENLTANGFNLDEYTYFDISVPANGLAAGTLELDPDALEFCQIAQLKTMILQFELRNPNTWADKGTTGYCAFPVEAPADYVQPGCDDGPLIYEDENVRLTFQGIRMIPALHHDQMVEDAQLLYYVENKTGEDLSVYTSDTQIAASDLWVHLPPCSKTVLQTVCTDVSALSGVDGFSTTLSYTDYDQLDVSRNVTIPLN